MYIISRTDIVKRAIFIDFIGCVLARNNWGTSPSDIQVFSDVEYCTIDIGDLKLIFPEAPSKIYGADVWVSVRRKTISKIKENSKKRSVMASLRSCSAIAVAIGIISLRDWSKFSEESLAPFDLPLPKSPNKTYGNDWIDWPTFLGKNKPKPFLTFNESKSLVQKLELTTVQEFRDYIHSGIANECIPKRPDHVYAEDWTGWASFLAPRFLSYEDAISALKDLNLASETDFRLLGTTGMRPEGVPSHPAIYYAEQWEGWSTFVSREHTLLKSKRTINSSS
jgi:hypothetical protein